MVLILFYRAINKDIESYNALKNNYTSILKQSKGGISKFWSDVKFEAGNAGKFAFDYAKDIKDTVKITK